MTIRLVALLSILAVPFSAQPMCNPCIVQQSSSIASATFPSSVAFSKDGCLAIANANPGNNTVTIYKPNSDCTVPTNPIATLTSLSGVNQPGQVAFSPTGCLAVLNIDTVTLYKVDPTTCTAQDVAVTTLTNANGLDSPVALAFSPNGCLAVANRGNDTVTIYKVDPATCSVDVTPVATLDTTNGINSPVAVAFSSTGCLAVANTGILSDGTDSTVTLYKVNADCTVDDTPAFTFDTTYGIVNPTALAFSTSSACLAVANKGVIGDGTDSTVTVYIIDIATCSFGGSSENDHSTLTNASGISNPTSVVFSPNECLAVANAGSLNDGSDSTVTIYTVNTGFCTVADSANSTLTNASGISNPASVAFSPSGCLAVANSGTQNNDDSVTLYTVDPSTCSTPDAATATIANKSSLISASDLAFSPSGCLAVPQGGFGIVSIYTISSDCTTTATPAVDLRSFSPNVIASAFSSNGCLAVADEGGVANGTDSTVKIYKVDPATCTTQDNPVSTLTNASGISNPRALAYSASGCLVVANTGVIGDGSDSTVTFYKTNTADCTTPDTALFTLTSADGINLPTAIAFSTTDCLAIANSGNNTVNLYTIDPVTCKPTATGTITNGVVSPLSLAFSSTDCLAVGNLVMNSTNTVTLYKVDTATCSAQNNPLVTLTDADVIFAFSSQGCFAVVNGARTNVNIYSIDSATCSLSATPLSTLGEAQGLGSVQDLAYSPSGCLAVSNTGGSQPGIILFKNNCTPTPTVTPLPVNKKFSCLARAILNKYCTAN
ncbi:beta-propeller fold lactonase family protein [Candidatus Dependentiae bacterium]|nr:beta-propeller fold lactonase family protein [Candidatus Dependentiae bacterium]